jgi:hypothetical protein
VSSLGFGASSYDDGGTPMCFLAIRVLGVGLDHVWEVEGGLGGERW